MGNEADVRAEMGSLKQTVYRMWIDGGRGNNETAEQKAERYRLTDRWYELRRQLRAS